MYYWQSLEYTWERPSGLGENSTSYVQGTQDVDHGGEVVRLITCFIDKWTKPRAFATSGLFFSMSLRVKLSIPSFNFLASFSEPDGAGS